MITTKLTSKFAPDERETILRYDPFEKLWTMSTNIPKHFNKAIKQGWEPVIQELCEDGTVCGMTLVAAERAITIKSPKKRELSETQRNNLLPMAN